VVHSATKEAPNFAAVHVSLFRTYPTTAGASSRLILLLSLDQNSVGFLQKRFGHARWSIFQNNLSLLLCDKFSRNRVATATPVEETRVVVHSASKEAPKLAAVHVSLLGTYSTTAGASSRLILLISLDLNGERFLQGKLGRVR